MTCRQRLALLAATALLLVATATSCIRRPLEVYYLERAKLMLHVDWLSEYGVSPGAAGMSVYVYDADSNERCLWFQTNEVDSVPVELPVGRYKVIVFTAYEQAYSSFAFSGAEDFNAFCTTGRANKTRKSQAWDAGTNYFWEPDEQIGVAVDSFDVTQDMMDRQLTFLSYHDRDEAYTRYHDFHVYTMARPRQTMVHIRVHVNGMENMYRLEASLDGMADGCSMAHTWRNTQTSTVFYDSDKWNYFFDAIDSKHGWVYIDIPTWGEPHGKELAEQRDSTDNVLRMNFTLRNQEERYWEFCVGHIIEYHDPQQLPNRLTPPDVLRHLYVEINREIPLLPDVPHEEGMGAGFDAKVDPWDDGGQVDLGTF